MLFNPYGPNQCLLLQLLIVSGQKSVFKALEGVYSPAYGLNGHEARGGGFSIRRAIKLNNLPIGVQYGHRLNTDRQRN